MANETGSALVNTPDSRSKYPLHIAAKKGFVELVKVSWQAMSFLSLTLSKIITVYT